AEEAMQKSVKNEEALQESEAYLKNILETVDQGFIVVDRDFRILSANRAFRESVNLNAEQIAGQTCHGVSHDTGTPCYKKGEECPVKKVFETGEMSSVLHIHTHPDGSKHYAEIKAFPFARKSGVVTSAIETITDVTETKLLEEQLRHSQKLESLGTLAGGVAHDFNNILNVIMGYGGMMEMRMAKDDANVAYLHEMMKAADRAANLTKALLIFSRKQSTIMKQMDINAFIAGIRKTLFRLIGEDIETVISLAIAPLPVTGDQGQLEQVLMNLASNARDAMPDGGMLRIETALNDLDREFIHMHGYGKPGKYAVISVSDTGEGMEDNTCKRIFEPFYTTKGVGMGTGLGLSIVYGIVKQHNGYIDCSSEPGKGTTFKIYLPVIEDQSYDFDLEAEVSATVRGGNETILVADDDESIRKLTRAILEKFGYTVIEAVDGADAVDKFSDNKDRIDLVLLDVIMPRKSGRQAFEEIRGIRTDIDIIFMSGYSEDIIQRKRIIGTGLPLIQKPVKPEQLLAKIREVLDAKY
ncbi:MAG TPA: ATP-binding protein, partial [Dissulfurispiraceae bacterium]|nr:ATP-binding protein [Dissulfurispiraceae bacterium]